jgi:hypothetical protein
MPTVEFEEVSTSTVEVEATITPTPLPTLTFGSEIPTEDEEPLPEGIINLTLYQGQCKFLNDEGADGVNDVITTKPDGSYWVGYTLAFSRLVSETGQSGIQHVEVLDVFPDDSWPQGFLPRVDYYNMYQNGEVLGDNVWYFEVFYCYDEVAAWRLIQQEWPETAYCNAISEVPERGYISPRIDIIFNHQQVVYDCP